MIYNLKNSDKTIISNSFLGWLFLFCFLNFGFAQNIHFTENTFIANADQINLVALNQPPNTATPNKPVIYVLENTIVHGLRHCELQIKNIYVNKQLEQRELTISEVKDTIVAKKATHVCLFAKTPFQNKYNYQALQDITIVVTNTFKKQNNKVLLKYNYNNYILRVHKENSISSFCVNTPNYQNSKSYKILCYFPPPSVLV